jgi:hypothetical protein
MGAGLTFCAGCRCRVNQSFQKPERMSGASLRIPPSSVSTLHGHLDLYLRRMRGEFEESDSISPLDGLNCCSAECDRILEANFQRRLDADPEFKAMLEKEGLL